MKIYLDDCGIELDIVVESTILNRGSSFTYQNVRNYFNNIVKENLKEFYEDETNYRKAINSCITLYNMPDWYCKTKEEKKIIWIEIPYNDALGSIANGTKHFNQNKPYRTGRKTISDEPNKLILNNGEKVIELKQMLVEIEKYWESKLYGKQKNI